MRTRLGSLLIDGLEHVAIGVTIVVVGVLLAPASLGAGFTGPPRFEAVLNEELFSTRALLALELAPEGLATKWTAWYGTSPTGPWTEVDNKEITESEVAHDNSFTAYIGASDREVPGGSGSSTPFFLRGLKTGTSYYARFVAVNKDGEAVKVVPFSTRAVEKPEVDRYYSSGINPIGTTFQENNKLTDTTDGFHAKIDADGAAATYRFEYASSPEGPWKLFTSGGSGKIDAGEEYAWVEANLAGLTPETIYYIRLKAGNEKGEVIQDTEFYGKNSFKTLTAEAAVLAPEVRNVTTESAYIDTGIAPHGSETEWLLEYATSAEGPWSPVPGGAGAISQTQAEAHGYAGVLPGNYGVRLIGLSATTTYYVRAFAKNTCAVGCGSVTSEVASFTTGGPPAASVEAVHGLHGESLRLLGSVDPNSAPTSAEQSIAIEGSPTGGTFTLTFDGESTGAMAMGDTTAGSNEVTGVLTLAGVVVPGELVSGSGIPAGTTILQTHGAKNETLVLSAAASASVTGVALTADLPRDASADAVGAALDALPANPELRVEGADGGPYTVSYFGRSGGVSEPPIVGDGSGLTPAGTVTVTTTLPGGVAYDTHYRFEYVSQKGFAEHGWAQSVEGPEEDAGSGTSPEYVGYDLPSSLIASETYRYRMVAQSNAPGISPVESAEATLTVPIPPVVVAEGCGNEALRTGDSAHLPDCRAYEQLSPVDKEGAQEPFKYAGSILSAVLVGEDGGHAVLETQTTDWGKGPEAGQSPYLFSREEGGWGLVAGAAQPETGVERDHPQVYSPDLTQVAFASEYETGAGRSTDVEYKLGRVGGPYSTVASVPRRDIMAEGVPTGWVAGDPGLSKLVFATADRTLVSKEPTGTKSGYDLYEYTTQNGLRQLNVSDVGGETVTIGSCGARVVKGYEYGEEERVGTASSPHSLSADGSRVFFEAVPGRKCGEEARNLYMRVNSSETVDIGAYTFLAADASGSSLLLQSESDAREVVLYDTESKSAKPLPGLAGLTVEANTHLVVSADLGVAYFVNGGLYRYDIHGGKLEYLMSISSPNLTIVPDGRYLYFDGAAGGMPGGGIYRYDNGEHVVSCISCASPFDPEPKLPAFLNSVSPKPQIQGSAPLDASVSGDGRYAFFTTPAALVRQDVDGEIPIEGGTGGGLYNGEYGDVAQTTSPSSDIYEWRGDGIHGCVQPQGCLALITDGLGGYKSLLLGSTDEGRDVLIYTREKLLPQDNGSEGNIFDAREGGGYEPALPRPIECEADACSTPPSAPNDSTPSSFMFNGPGNLAPAVRSASGTKAKSNKSKRKRRVSSKKRKRGSRAKKTARNGRRAKR